MKYAGFWRRLVAHIIDSLILNLAAWLGGLVILGGMYLVYRVIAHSHGAMIRPFEDAFDPFMTQILETVIYILLAGIYFTVGHYRYSTTLGKRPFGIYVVDAQSGERVTLRQSFIRFISYFVSYLPFGAGFVMAAFHPRKRALHDLIAGTVSVIKEP